MNNLWLEAQEAAFWVACLEYFGMIIKEDREELLKRFRREVDSLCHFGVGGNNVLCQLNKLHKELDREQVD